MNHMLQRLIALLLTLSVTLTLLTPAAWAVETREGAAVRSAGEADETADPTGDPDAAGQPTDTDEVPDEPATEDLTEPATEDLTESAAESLTESADTPDDTGDTAPPDITLTEDTAETAANADAPEDTDTGTWEIIYPAGEDERFSEELPDLIAEDGDAVAASNSGTVYITKADAMNYVRGEMKTRQTEISVAITSAVFNEWFWVEGGELKGDYDALWAHDPADPAGGDYLHKSIEQFGAGYRTAGDGVCHVTFVFSYHDTTAEEAAADTKVAELVTSLELNNSDSDLEKLRRIYSYTIRNVTYDYDTLNAGTSNYPEKFTGYGALVRGKAVCQGYASMIYRLCLEAGIDCRIIDSDTMVHAWNIVKLGDWYYLLDCTWDDPDEGEDEADTEWNYFLRGYYDFMGHDNEDDQFHRIEGYSAQYPVALDRYGYDSQNLPTAPEYVVITKDRAAVSTAATNGRAKVVIFFYDDEGCAAYINSLAGNSYPGVDFLFVNFDQSSAGKNAFLAKVGTVYSTDVPGQYATAGNGYDIVDSFLGLTGLTSKYAYFNAFLINAQNEIIYSGYSLPAHFDEYMAARMENANAPAAVTPAVPAEGTLAGQVGDTAYWHFKDGTLTIEGTGDLWDWNTTPTPTGIISDDFCKTSGAADTLHKSQVTAVVVGSGITGFGNYNFYNFSNLQTVTFTGDAPTFAPKQYNDTVTAYYPEGNDTWTDAYRSNCPLNATWVAQAPSHTHTMTHTAAVAATCSAPGNIEYWFCDDCGEYFSDAEGNRKISQDQTVVPVDNNAHDWGNWTVEQPATCKQEGSRVRSCAHNSNHIQRETIEKAPHNLHQEHAETPATCEAPGWKECWRCSSCGELFSDSAATQELSGAFISPLGHLWDNGVVTTQPTCTTYGVLTFTCQHDHSHTMTASVPMLGHDMEEIAEVPAACDKDGTLHHWHCKNCDKNFDDSNGTTELDDLTIPALPHQLTEVAEVPATCEGTGTAKHWHCESCGNDFSDAAGSTLSGDLTIAALDHLWGDWTVTVEPTCTEKGSQTRTCQRENAHTETREVPAAGHRLVHHEAVPATCEQSGTVEYWHCENCNKDFSDANGTTEVTDLNIPALPHQLTEVAEVPATCEGTGTAKHWHCQTCGNDFSDAAGTTLSGDLAIAALDHLWGDWTVTVEPTCTEKGSQTRTCQRENAHTETREVPATGHRLVHHEAVPATCEQSGTMEYWHCENCNKDFSDAAATTLAGNLTIAALDHLWGDWTVTVEPTCTEKGSQTRTCQRENAHTETREVPAAGHRLVHHEAVAATCEQNGTVEYWHCENCNKDFSDAAATTLAGNLTIPALRDISAAAVTGVTDKTYTGTAQTQSVKVTLDGSELTPGTDYTVSYSANTNVGTAKVIITGKGAYGGSKSVSFQIKAASISGAAVSGIANKTYSGAAQTQSVTVKLGGKTLRLNTDYTVSYQNNINAGTAKVVITGKGSYTGSVTKTFTIAPLSLAKATVTGIANKTYTGKAQTQKLTVKLSGKTLTLNTHFTVTYTNNTKVGAAKLTIKGKGNYSGSITKTFNILPKPTAISKLTPGTKQCKVAWKKVAGVGGYKVQYSTSKSFASKKTVTVKGVSSLNKVISGLTKGKTWYFRVCTWQKVGGKTYESNWSAVKSVKITK